MAKQVRMIVASEDVANLIDHGADVDVQLKNLTYEDKTIKSRIGSAAGEALEKGETSVRLKGNTAAAVVSAVEKYALQSDAEDFNAVIDAVDKGALQGVVSKKEDLLVPPDEIAKAAEILKQNGIKAMTGVTYSVEPGAYREMLEKPDFDPVEEQLQRCVEKSVSFRVSYKR